MDYDAGFSAVSPGSASASSLSAALSLSFRPAQATTPAMRAAPASAAAPAQCACPASSPKWPACANAAEGADNANTADRIILWVMVSSNHSAVPANKDAAVRKGRKTRQLGCSFDCMRGDLPSTAPALAPGMGQPHPESLSVPIRTPSDRRTVREGLAVIKHQNDTLLTGTAIPTW